MSAVAGHYDEPFFADPPVDAPRGPTGMLLSSHHLGDTPAEYAALQALTAIAGRGDRIKPLAAPQPVVTAWLDDLAKRQKAGERTSILDHSALTYALKGVLDAPKHAAAKTKLTEALRRSWVHLTGREPAELIQRLPPAVLAKARPIERDFNAHAFETPTHPQSLADHLAILRELAKDYVVLPQDVTAVALFTALAFTSPYLVGGLGIGLAGSTAVVTALEWLAHFAFGHPPEWLKTFIRTSPSVPAKVRTNFEGYWETHDLHHFTTFKESQFDRYSVPDHREKLVKMLRRRYSEEVVAEMERYGFGTSMDWKACVMYYAPTLAIATGIAAATTGLTLPILAGLAAGSMLLPWGSSVQHTSDHDRREKALQEAPNWLHRQYLKTRLARYNVKHHYVHHRYVKDDVNLNLNPGMDILMGRVRRAGMSDVLDMNYHRSI